MKPLFVLTCIALSFASVGTAEVIVDTLEATKDTYIDAFNMNATHGTETALTLWNEDEPQFFILIQFPLASAYQCMPDTLDFMGANLGMYCYYSGGSGTATVTGAYDSWGEGAVNYNNMPDVFEGPSVTGTNLPDMAGSWYSADVTPIVDSWLNGYDYVGFYVTADNPFMSWDFFSKDCDTCAFLADNEITPKLYLTWEITTGTCEELPEAIYFNATAFMPGEIKIDYSLPKGQTATLKVYDASGSVVETLDARSGNHSVIWNSPPGVYFVRLVSGSQTIVKKVVSIR